MKTRFKWHRALVAPKTHIESQDAEITRIRVDGLVCSTVCAARTKQALRALPGVRGVTVDFDTGIAVVEGAPQPPETYERAVTAVVAGMPLRRAIEAVSRRFKRRSAPAHGTAR